MSSSRTRPRHPFHRIDLGRVREGQVIPLRISFLTSTIMRAQSLLFGGTVSRDVPLFSKAYIQPYFGLGYTSTTLKLSDRAD